MSITTHWFKFELKNPDRMTTREQWRGMSQWLRISRNYVEKAINPDDITKALHNSLVYGIGRYNAK